MRLWLFRCVAIMAALALVMLFAACDGKEKPGLPADNIDAPYDDDKLDHELVDEPPKNDRVYREKWRSKVAYLQRGGLWVTDIDTGDTQRVTDLPGGYYLISGPVNGHDGERIFVVARDTNNAAWVLCYDVAEGQWETRFLPGASDWRGWVNGFVPRHDEPVVVWWRSQWDDPFIAGELFVTDLEEMSSSRVAIFFEEPFFPAGWSPDGEWLVFHPSSGYREADNAYLYLFRVGSETREVGSPILALEEPWLQVVERDEAPRDNDYIEWYFIGWNPYRRGDIWFNELSQLQGDFYGRVQVAPKRINAGGSGYDDLRLPFDIGQVWQVLWHPSALRFLALTNREPHPTQRYELWLVDLDNGGGAKKLADGVDGACWYITPAAGR